MKPEIHFFRGSHGERYCLDVSTMAVFSLDEASEEVLRALFTERPERMRARLGERFEPMVVDGAVNGVADLVERGFFPQTPPAVRRHPVEGRAVPDLVGISLLISSTCNLRCRYCFNSGGDLAAGGNRMDAGTALAAVDFLARSSTADTLGIDFFGGEPTLAFPLIEEVVDHCSRIARKFKFSLTTNGTILTERMLDLMVRSDFFVVVSYDGAYQDLERPARDGAARRSTIRENIGRYAAALPFHRLAVRTILTRGRRDFAELASEAQELGVRLAPGPITAPPSDPRNLTEEDVGAMLEFSRNELEHLIADGRADIFSSMTSIPNVLFRALRAQPRLRSCGLGVDILSVDPRGDLYPCHRFLGMEGYRMGNLRNGIDLTIYAAHVSRHVEAAEPCRTCWARYYCGGGCAHESLVYSGDDRIPPKQRCDLIRAETEIGLILFAKIAESRPEYFDKLKKLYDSSC